MIETLGVAAVWKQGFTGFEYSSIIVAIILGFALARLLTGIAHMIEFRHRTRAYWVHLLFVVFVFMQVNQYWWNWEYWHIKISWGLFEFMFLLLQPVAIFLLADTFFPTFPEKGTVDLRRYYYENHRWIFGLFAVFLALVCVEDLVMKSWSFERLVSSGAVTGLLMAVLLTVFSKPWLHATVAVVAVGTYVVGSFL